MIRTYFLHHTRGSAMLIGALLLSVTAIGVYLGIDVFKTHQQQVQQQNDLDQIAITSLQGYLRDIQANITHTMATQNANTYAANAFNVACKKMDQANSCKIDTHNLEFFKVEHLCQQGNTLIKNTTSNVCRGAPALRITVKYPFKSFYSGNTNYTIVSATALFKTPPTQLHILLDNSLSMGVSAAIDGDSNKDPVERLGVMWDNSATCFIACHEFVGTPIERTDDWSQKLSQRNLDTLHTEDEHNPYARSGLNGELILCDKDNQEVLNNDIYRMTISNNIGHANLISNEAAKINAWNHFYLLAGNFYCTQNEIDLAFYSQFTNKNQHTSNASSGATQSDFEDIHNNVMGINFYQRDGDLARALTNGGEIILDRVLQRLHAAMPAINRFDNVKIVLYRFKKGAWASNTNNYVDPDHLGEQTLVEKISDTETQELLSGRKTIDLVQPGSNFNSALQNFYDLVKNTPLPTNGKHLALFVSDGYHQNATEAFDATNSCKPFADNKIFISTMRIENEAWKLFTKIPYRFYNRGNGQKIEALNYVNCNDADKAITNRNTNTLNGPDKPVLDQDNLLLDCDQATDMSDKPIAAWNGNLVDDNGNYHSGGGYTSGASRMATTQVLLSCAKHGGGQFFNSTSQNIEKTFAQFADYMNTTSNVVLSK